MTLPESIEPVMKFQALRSTAYYLAEAVHHMRPSSRPRGQILTWHDGWYRGARKRVKAQRMEWE